MSFGKLPQRELATGFYYQTPTENEQLFGARRKIPQYKFVGEVVAFDEETMTATIRQRNVILEGDAVEFYGPGFVILKLTSKICMMLMAIKLIVLQIQWNY